MASPDRWADAGPGPLAQFTWTLPDGVSLESAPVVAPDQARLVFVGAEASGRRLFARDLSSLDTVAIPGTEGARQSFWSPDGQSIGFFAGGKLMKVALRGGAPAASCCGRSSIRSRGNPDIWVEDLARGTRVRVTTSRGFDVSPVWSTDGRRIAFRTGTISKAHLAVAAADGTGNHAVLSAGGM